MVLVVGRQPIAIPRWICSGLRTFCGRKVPVGLQRTLRAFLVESWHERTANCTASEMADFYSDGVGVKMRKSSKRARIVVEIRKFCANMSAHGVPRLVAAEQWCTRMMWTLVLVVCLASFGFHAIQIIAKFQRNDKIVNIAILFDVLPFPAVTICNLNPYKQTAMSHVLEIKRRMNNIESLMTKEEKGHVLQKRSATPRYVPGLSVCACPARSIECFPRISEPSENTQMCICFHDSKAGVTWPCYKRDVWIERKCSNCSSQLGTCPFPDTSQKSSSGSDRIGACLCQNISNYCLDVNRPSDLALEDMLVSLWQPTTTSDWLTSSAEPTSDLLDVLGYQNTVGEQDDVLAKVREDITMVAATLDEEVRVNLSYASEDIIKLCWFNGKTCDMKRDFHLHLDAAYGNCFTFNKNSNKTTKRAGPDYGLKVTAHLNPSEYLHVTESAGLRIAVHEPQEYPFPDNFGYNAAVGQMTSFGVQLKRLTRLPEPNGDCVFDKDGKPDSYLYKNYSYSTEGCFRSCLQNYVVQECGCADPRFPRPVDAQYCSALNVAHRKCSEHAFDTVYASRDYKNCACRQPCQQSIFEISISTARWPVNVYQLPKDCPLKEHECLNEYKQNGAMIEVFYERLSHEVLLEAQAYGTSTLLADFGGQLGLWMGVSVITLTELLVLLWNILLICCEERRFDQVPTEESMESDASARTQL